MEKSQSLTFMNYRKKHFVILNQSSIWLLKSQCKHWPVSVYVFQGWKYIVFLQCQEPPWAAASILICLVFFFFWASCCWDFLPNWFRDVLLEKCKDCFSEYIQEAFYKPGLLSMASVIPFFIISLSISLTLPSLLTVVWEKILCAYSSKKVSRINLLEK